MQITNNPKNKIFSLVFRISIVVFICMLSFLDAPEYVHCSHIGICEFLEVCGDLSNNQRSKMLAESIRELSNQVYSSKNHFKQTPCFPPLFKSMDCWACLFQNQSLSHMLQFLYRYTRPSHKLVFPFLKTNNKIPENKKHISPLIKSSLHSLLLQLISTSIIKS